MPRTKQTDLVLINLRLRQSDVQAARKRAEHLHIPYQHVIREWVAARGMVTDEKLDRKADAS